MINTSISNVSQGLPFRSKKPISKENLCSLPQSITSKGTFHIVRQSKLPISLFRFSAVEMEDDLPVSKNDYKVYLWGNEPAQGKKGSAEVFRHLAIVPPGKMLQTLPTAKQVMLIAFKEDLLITSAISAKCIIKRKAFQKNAILTFDLTAQDSLMLLKTINVIEEELTDGHAEMFEMITIKLLEMFILCDGLTCQVSEPGSLTERHPVIEQFNQLVDRYCNKERSVRYYADTIGIHPNHLNYLVKKYAGANAKECINNRIVQRSKQLLSQPGLIIKEIAYRLGFDDPNNFSTFFQKYTGTSPAAFRTNASGAFYA